MPLLAIHQTYRGGSLNKWADTFLLTGRGRKKKDIHPEFWKALRGRARRAKLKGTDKGNAIVYLSNNDLCALYCLARDITKVIGNQPIYDARLLARFRDTYDEGLYRRAKNFVFGFKPFRQYPI